MKSPRFVEGVWVALAAALSASFIHAGLAPLLGAAAALRLIIAGLGFTYVLYLLYRSPQRLGRVIVVAACLCLAVLIEWTVSDLTLYSAAHLGVIWVVRALYHQPGLFAALTDLALTLFAWSGAIWALSHAGSLLLAVWTLFLIQALFTAIPRISKTKSLQSNTNADDCAAGDFQQAWRNAESALRDLVVAQNKTKEN